VQGTWITCRSAALGAGQVLRFIYAAAKPWIICHSTDVSGVGHWQGDGVAPVILVRRTVRFLLARPPPFIWIGSANTTGGVRTGPVHSRTGLSFPLSSGQRDLAVAAYRVLANGGRLFLAAPTASARPSPCCSRRSKRWVKENSNASLPDCPHVGEPSPRKRWLTCARAIEASHCDAHRQGKSLHSRWPACDPQTCPLPLVITTASNQRYAMPWDGKKSPIRPRSRGQNIRFVPLNFHWTCPPGATPSSVITITFLIPVYLPALAEGGGQYGFLVDEAHNLVDRAREMFSADLDGREILEVRRALKQAAPRCAKALARLNSGMRKLGGPTADSEEPVEVSDPSVELNLFPVQAAPASEPPQFERPKFAGGQRWKNWGQHEPRVAETLIVCWKLRSPSGDLAGPEPAGRVSEDLLALYFRLHSFRRTAELYDERYVTIIENAPSVKCDCFV